MLQETFEEYLKRGLEEKQAMIQESSSFQDYLDKSLYGKGQPLEVVHTATPEEQAELDKGLAYVKKTKEDPEYYTKPKLGINLLPGAPPSFGTQAEFDEENKQLNILLKNILKGATAGKLFKDEFFQPPKAEGLGEQARAAGGHLAGFVAGAPMAAGKLAAGATVGKAAPAATRLLAKFIGEKGAVPIGKLLTGLASEQVSLGTAFASEAETLKEVPARFKSGVGLATAFFGGRFINPSKYPKIAQVLRQVGTRALASVTSDYDAELPKKLKSWVEGGFKGEPDIGFQELWDEALITWFSKKGVNKEQFFLDLSKIQVEMEKTGFKALPWTPYSERPGPEIMSKVPATFVGGVRGPVQYAHPQLTEGRRPMAEYNPYNEAAVKNFVKTINPDFVSLPGGQVIPIDLFNPKTPPADAARLAQRAMEIRSQGVGQLPEKAGVEPRPGEFTPTKPTPTEQRLPDNLSQRTEFSRIVDDAMGKLEGTKQLKGTDVQERQAVENRIAKELRENPRYQGLAEIPDDVLSRITNEELGELREVEPDTLVKQGKELSEADRAALEAKGVTVTQEKPFEALSEAEALKMIKPEEPEPEGLGVPTKPKGKPEYGEKLPRTWEESKGDVDALARIRKAEKKAGEEFDREFKKSPDKTIKYLQAGLNLRQGLKDVGEWLYDKYSDPAKYGIKTTKDLHDRIVDIAIAEKGPKIGYKVIHNLDRFGEPGKRLSKLSIDYIRNRAQGEQYDLYRLSLAHHALTRDFSNKEKIFNAKKVGDKVGQKIYDLLEGKVQPKTPLEKEALDTLQDIFSKLAKRAMDADLKIRTPFGEKSFVPRENYAPREYKNLKKFLDDHKNFKHVKDLYLEELAKEYWPELDRVEGIERAETFWQSLRSDLQSRPYGHLERARILGEDALARIEAKWNKLHPGEEFPLQPVKNFDAITRYIVGANDRLAWIESFGKDVKSGNKYVPDEVHKSIIEMKTSETQGYTRKFFERYLKSQSFLDPKIIRLGRAIRTAQLTKLAFAFIPNSLQWFTNTLPQIDWTSTLPKTIVDLAKYSGAGGAEAKRAQKEWFNKTGAATFKRAYNQALMEDPGKVSRFADIMLKFHGFSGTEYFNALFSGTAGKHRSIALSSKLYKSAQKGNTWRHPFYRAELKKLGLSEPDIEFIIKNGPMEMNDRWFQQLADASFHMRRGTQFLSDAFHLPSSWSTPGGRVLTQFKNFAYNQTSMLYNDVIKDAGRFIGSGGKRGDITKIFKAIPALALAGAAVVKMRKEIYKGLGVHFYEELLAGKSWPAKMWFYTLNAGGLGIASDMLFAAAYGKVGLMSFLAGPTGSDLFNIAEAVSKTGEEISIAWDKKNPKWISHRSKYIASYWERFGERLSPDLRIPIQVFFSKYKDAKTLSNWGKVVTDAYKEYKELYKLKSPTKAEQFWQAFMETQGREYEQLTGKKPNKPTPKQIEQWWKERGSHPSEAMRTPGSKKTSKDYWELEYWK